MNSRDGDAIPRVLLSDAIYQSLRSDIVDGAYASGERIGEMGLAKRFNTSQGPVREALRRLEQEGLVATVPHKGTFVAGVLDKEVEEISELRSAIEGIAIKWLISRLAEEDVQTLQGTVDEMKELAARGDISGLVEKDVEFHRYICTRASDSQNLLRMWSTVDGKARLAIAASNRLENQDLNQIATRHESIVKAIALRDVKLAIQANQEHIALLMGEPCQKGRTQ